MCRRSSGVGSCSAGKTDRKGRRVDPSDSEWRYGSVPPMAGIFGELAFDGVFCRSIADDTQSGQEGYDSLSAFSGIGGDPGYVMNRNGESAYEGLFYSGGGVYHASYAGHLCVFNFYHVLQV